MQKEGFWSTLRSMKDPATVQKWVIEWKPEINSYERNVKLENYTGLSADEISQMFEDNDQYMADIVQKLLTDAIAEQKFY